MSENSKIIRLTAENFKRIQAVTISPDGNVVTVAGENGSGKTSTLDAIWATLGGKDAVPDMPVRKGEKKGFTEVELDTFIIRRTYNSSGTTSLKVVNKKDSSELKSPQALLDALVGKLSFDPLDFARGTSPDDDRRRSEVLRGLVGLDFSQLNSQREQLFEQRRNVNRSVDSNKARLVGLPAIDPNLPAEEVSAQAILDEMSKASVTNSENAQKRQFSEGKRREWVEAQNRLTSAESEVARLKKELAEAEAAASDAAIAKDESEAAAQKAARAVEGLQDIDLSPFRTRASEVDEQNRKIRANNVRREYEKKLKADEESAATLTSQIEALDATKRKQIADAKFPIEGLSFDDDGRVVFNGVPFNQASAAEQLKCSLAIGLGLNPTLKVILIRDASLLDRKSMQQVSEVAEKNQAQVWLEVVGSPENATVVIEDGAVKD